MWRIFNIFYCFLILVPYGKHFHFFSTNFPSYIFSTLTARGTGLRLEYWIIKKTTRHISVDKHLQKILSWVNKESLILENSLKSNLSGRFCILPGKIVIKNSCLFNPWLKSPSNALWHSTTLSLLKLKALTLISKNLRF